MAVDVGAGSALPATDMSIMITRFTRARQVTNTVVKTLQEFSELGNVHPKFQAKYYALVTRLGELRAVSFDVNADGIAKRCLGFHTPGGNAVFVKGYVCAGDQAAVAPQYVACLVDRVRFVRQADEDALKTILDHSESRECSATLLDPKKDASENSAKDTL